MPVSCPAAPQKLYIPDLESSLEVTVDAIWGNLHSPRDVPWAGLQLLQRQKSCYSERVSQFDLSLEGVACLTPT